jgi:iron-sulfur cluster assembly accessory protein
VSEPAERRAIDDAIGIHCPTFSPCRSPLAPGWAVPGSHLIIEYSNRYRQVMASSVELTDRAARRIREILKTERPGSMLRVSVAGDGCSGFQYKFDCVTAQADDDLVLAHAGATALVDPVSVQYMAGAEIDFVDDLIGSSFRINDPLATALRVRDEFCGVTGADYHESDHYRHAPDAHPGGTAPWAAKSPECSPTPHWQVIAPPVMPPIAWPL